MLFSWSRFSVTTRMKQNLLLLFCLNILLISPATASLASDEAMTIGEILVEGNRRIETATILSHIGIKPGDPFSPKQIRRDIQAVYDTGFFRNISVDARDFEGKLKLTFIVEEKPAVKEINLEGNDEINEEQLRKIIDIKVNSILDELALEKNVQKLKKRYEQDGFYLAEISYSIEELSPYSVAVTFNIEEGDEVILKQIKFEGNHDFSDEELKQVMETTEHWFMSWLTGSGYLEEQVLEQDMERLLSFYFDRGYLHARVGDPEVTLSRDKTELSILIPVEEGPQFSISSIHFKGNHIIETALLAEKLESEAGELFNRSKVRKDVAAISNQYAEQGYLLTEVYPTTKENARDKTVAITFNIIEGKITYAGRISISGNDSTRDKVIRRQLQFVEGDVLTSSKLRRSHERIQNLGFFEKVDMQTKKNPRENTLDIDLKVKERLTGSFNIGAGWSSVNQIVGNVSISQGNLFGRGQKLILSGSIGRVTQDYRLSFTEPWLFDTPLSAGIDLYMRTRRQLRFSRYQVNRTGVALPFSYPLSDYLRAYFTYRYEEVEILNVPTSATNFLKRQEGATVTSSTLFSLVRDSRDSWTRPTRGSRNKISYEIAGSALGGDNYYQRLMLDSGWHFPLFWRVVFSLRGRCDYEFSYAGRDLPLQELLTAGGAQTVRGFQYSSLGPREDGQVVGGNKRIIFNYELNFPLVDPLAGVIFYDMGNAFAEGENYQMNNLRTSAGVGLRFFTPVGPIRLDWGYKLDRKATESAYEWHFAMGTYF